MKLNDKQFEDAYTAAGAWFVVKYIDEVKKNIEKFNNTTYKNKFIEDIFNNGNGPDSKLSGTRTRVNSIIRIVKSDCINEALKKAINSNRLKNEIRETAKNKLNKVTFLTSENDIN